MYIFLAGSIVKADAVHLDALTWLRYLKATCEVTAIHSHICKHNLNQCSLMQHDVMQKNMMQCRLDWCLETPRARLD